MTAPFRRPWQGWQRLPRPPPPPPLRGRRFHRDRGDDELLGAGTSLSSFCARQACQGRAGAWRAAPEGPGASASRARMGRGQAGLPPGALVRPAKGPKSSPGARCWAAPGLLGESIFLSFISFCWNRGKIPLKPAPRVPVPLPMPCNSMGACSHPVRTSVPVGTAGKSAGKLLLGRAARKPHVPQEEQDQVLSAQHKLGSC